MGIWDDASTHGIEHELTLRLERASDLSKRAKRANDAVRHEIDRALEIADELRGVSEESEVRAGRLRARSTTGKMSGPTNNEMGR